MAYAQPTVTTDPATSIAETSAILNATVNPNGDATTVTFEIDGNGGYCQQNIGSGTSNVAVTCDTTTLSNPPNPLTPSTTYTFKAVAINSINITDGNLRNFTTLASSPPPGAPIISTTSATGVGTNSATLNGTWNDNNDTGTSTWFDWSIDPLNLSNSTSSVSQGTGSGNMSANISGLAENTTYYFQAYGQNTQGTSFGSMLSFTTTSSGGGGGGGGGPTLFPPAVTTTAAASITKDSAVLNGTFDSKGYSTDVWFEYDTDTSLDSSTSQVIQNSTSSGSANITLSGLQENTTYYFRAVAQNTYGTTNGNTLSFTTGTTTSTETTSDDPTAITTVATLKTITSAKLNGLILIPDGTDTDAWFAYGETIAMDTITTKQSIGNGSSVSFSQTITGLKADTVYFFRVIASNPNGSDNGDIMVFKTLESSEPNDTTETSGGGETGTDDTPGGGTEIETGVISSVSLQIETVFEEVAIDDSVIFTTVYKNTGEKTLRDVVLRIILPQDIGFRKSSAGVLSSFDNTVTVDLETLDPGAGGSVYIEGQVLNTTGVDEILLTTATMIYKTGTSELSEDVIAYALQKVVEESPNLLAAAAASAVDRFLPNSFIGWFLSIIALIALLLLGRKLYISTNASGRISRIFSK